MMYLLSQSFSTGDGCDRLNVEIEMMLDLDSGSKMAAHQLSAQLLVKDQGVDELIDALDEHL